MSVATALQKKHGPLKTWQWGGLLAGAVILGLYLRSRNASTAAADQTVNPDSSALDPWTGFPNSGLGGPMVSGDAGAPGSATDTTVPVTMDPPDWYTNPPDWWTTAPGSAPNQDNGVASSAGNDGEPAGANSAKASHTQVTPPKPKPTPASVTKVKVTARGNASTGSGTHATSGTPQTTNSGAPLHTNNDGEHYETIVKDHKVYHFYPNRSGPTKYVYIRPQSH